MPAAVITDHGHIHGWPEHEQACKDAGIKPIFGFEAYQARKTRFDMDAEELSGPATHEWEQRGPYHLTVMAKDRAGYDNIIKLASKAYLDGFYGKPRLDMQLIADHSNGLVIMSGCLGGQVQQALLLGNFEGALKAAQTMQDIVGKENYFIELHDHGIEEQLRVKEDLLKIAKMIGAKVAPSADCHYVEKSDYLNHDALLCQPGDTLVKVMKGDSIIEVPLSSVIVGNKVLSWSPVKRRGQLSKNGNLVTQVASRHFKGKLITVKTDSGLKSSYTPEHICVARMDSPLSEGNYVTYVMKKGKSFRIGSTQFQRQRSKQRPVGGVLGPVARSKEQLADAIWVLGVYDSLEKAREEEYFLSHKYGIPTWSFAETRSITGDPRTPYYKSLWERVGDLTENAKTLIEDFDRRYEYPFWDNDTVKPGQRRPVFVRACNLLSGMLFCDIRYADENGKTYDGSNAWRIGTVSKSDFDNTVYSLDVENDHTYIADGIVTHNCIQTKATIASEERFKFANDEFYLKSRAEMEEKFEPEWLDNTLDIAEMCNVEIERGEYHFPKFQPPEGKNRQDFFEEIVWEGAKKEYGILTDELIERVKYECKVITDSGFVPYFLIVWDIVNWAKTQGIRVGKGRGSVTGSVVSFVMGITGIDPMKYDLLFERFLIEGRASMPDIDLDFDDRRRDEVIGYVRDKYGADHIANIVTLSSIKARSAISDAGRVLGYDYPFVNKLSNFVPPPVNGVSKTLDECMQDTDFLKIYNEDENAKKIIDVARGLEGVYRQTGVHASGILITDKPVIEYVPVLQKNLKDGSRGPVVTQWVGEEIDRNGLLKIDFLGLANLSMIDICVENVKKFRGIDIDVDALPLDDKKTYELYHEGNTIGCFQVAGEGMRGLMKEMKPDNIKDIMALVSLYRPGPMGPGMHKMYVERKHGRAPLDYVHPLLKEDLSAGYGVFIYQENLLTAARILAGFNAAEADDLRKAMGKKKPEVMAKLKEKFIDGCIATNQMPRHMADSIFTDIEYFAGYGFGKGHAAAYAELSYTTAYLKANYPVEYMAAALDSSTYGKTDLDAMREYLAESRRMGLKVLPPNVTKSGPQFDVASEDEIRFGLSGIGGIGGAIMSALITDETRAGWKTIDDMFKNAEKSVLNKGTFEKFLYAGALDDLLPEADDQPITELDIIKTLSLEKSALGLFVSDNPVERLASFLKSKSTHQIDEVNTLNTRTRVKIAGMIDNFEQLKTRAGKKMWNFKLEDSTGIINGFCYDTIIDELPGKLENNKFYILEAAATFDRANADVRNLVLYNFQEVNLESIDIEPSIDIIFNEPPHSDLMKKITKLLERSKGKSTLKIVYNVDGITYETTYKHKVSNTVKKSIDELIEMSKVEVWN